MRMVPAGEMWSVVTLSSRTARTLAPTMSFFDDCDIEASNQGGFLM